MDTIKQKIIAVPRENEKTIDVRRMPWGKLCEFMKLIGAQLSTLKKERQPEEAMADLIVRMLPDLISTSADLSTFIGAHSSRMSLDEFNALDGLVASQVVNAALTLNTDDELKNSLAGISAKLVGLMPAGALATTKSGAASTPTSSTPDTTQPTSTAAQS